MTNLLIGAAGFETLPQSGGLAQSQWSDLCGDSHLKPSIAQELAQL
jgi:hypothetical protein